MAALRSEADIQLILVKGSAKYPKRTFLPLKYFPIMLTVRQSAESVLSLEDNNDKTKPAERRGRIATGLRLLREAKDDTRRTHKLAGSRNTDTATKDNRRLRMNKLIRSSNVVGLFFLLAMGVTGLAYADGQEFEATLSGAQEVMGGTDTPATGRINAKFDNAFTKVRVNLRIKNLMGTFVGAHFHCARPGQNGPVAFGLVNPGPLAFDGKRIRGTLTNADFFGVDCTDMIGRPVNNIAALAFAMRDGLIYTNVHSIPDFPGGEIRGQMLRGDDDDSDSDSDSD